MIKVGKPTSVYVTCNVVDQILEESSRLVSAKGMLLHLCPYGLLKADLPFFTLPEQIKW